MKRKKMKNQTPVIESIERGKVDPKPREEFEVYTLLDYYNDDKPKKLSLKTYGDDLL